MKASSAGSGRRRARSTWRPRRSSTRSGIYGPRPRQTGLEAGRRPDAGAVRRVRRLPLLDRRAHARARRSISCGATRRRAPAREAEMRSPTAIRPTSRRRAGWAIRTIRCARCAARRWPPGWTRFKIKVGLDRDENIRRCAMVREEIGPECRLMLDANQAWDVGEAIEQMRPLARFDPLWIEEPTSPDDILGHAAIRRGDCADRRRHRRTLPEPRDVQAVDAGGCDRLLPVRQLPAGRPQRSDGGAAAGGEVRRAGLPARRRAGACANTGSTSR